MRKHWKWLALLAALVLVVAACGDSDGDAGGDGDGTTVTTEVDDTTPPDDGGDGDMAGTTVNLFGPESSEEEAGALQEALDVFAAESGIEITYTGARDFSDQINAQVVGGNPPDIAIFPQPGKLADFARDGNVQAVPQSVVDTVAAQWPESWMGFGNVDGTQYGVPNKSDLKSLVWYKPATFAEKGYEIPETWDDLKALADEMIANGDTPWCVGIESGPATGWTFTDWNEDLLLRFEGADYYDQWVNHEVPFNSPEIENIWNEILNEWNKPGAVYAAGGSIAATPFGDNGQPLADGQCMMHRQASFFAAFYPEGTTFGDDAEVSVFYFPAVDPSTRPVLVAGTLAAAFRDAPEVWAVMEYMGTAEFAETRQRIQTEKKGGGLSGFLSANTDQDLSVYQPLEASFVEILQTGDPARFDGSDLMPAAVGAGSFWTEATSAVNGDKSIADALAAIEDSWPTE